jgi:hypothetical protein
MPLRSFLAGGIGGIDSADQRYSGIARKAWECRTENRAIMRFEDLFEDEDADAIEGAREEMMENASLREGLCGKRRASPQPSAFHCHSYPVFV